MSLITNVTVSDRHPLIGQSILITVHIKDPLTEININGAFGTSRFIQFETEGLRDILITARLQGSIELHSERVKVRQRTQGDPIYPIVLANMSPYYPRTVIFSISNAQTALTDIVTYSVDFGDGTHGMTENGYLVHDYSHALRRDEQYSSFTIRVDSRHRDDSITSAMATLTLFNLYALNKTQNKILTPWVTPTHYPSHRSGTVDCTFTITNLEDEDIVFDDERHEFLEAAQPATSALDPFSLYVLAGASIAKEVRAIGIFSQGGNSRVPARSSITVTRRFPWSTFKTHVFGVAIHLRGTGVCSKLMAIASAYVEVRLPLEWSTIVDNGSTVKTLNTLSRYLGKKEAITHHDVSQIVRSSKNANQMQAAEITSSSITNPYIGNLDTQVSRQTNARSTAGKIVDIPPSRLHDLNDFEVLSAIRNSIGQGKKYDLQDDVVVGHVCDPDNLPDNPGEGMVCQSTGEIQWHIVPGRLLKAKKGDLIIDPGGSGIIGQLLNQLSQRYSHCGIMTKNHVELKHATESEDWLQSPGNESGAEGILGFHQSALTYGWPGTLCQSIDQAINGSSLTSPEGNAYQIKDFSFQPASLSNRVIVNPLVIKPNPFTDTNELRLKLHAIAEEALNIKGHYRFYCYTKPDIALDATGIAGPEAGWAKDTTAVVCSSFIWLAAQKAEIQLEGPGIFSAADDLELTDTNNGAQTGVDSSGTDTRDGLYFYSENNRRVVAQWLHDYIKKTVADKIPNLISINPLDWIGWTTAKIYDAADDVANQLVNTFAFDWNSDDAKESDKWKNPGAANAVSPDDLLFWDSPDTTRNKNGFGSVYGYYEEAIYMPGGWAPVEVFKWKHVETKGKLTGTVVGAGGGDISGTTVSIDSNHSVTVNSSGIFAFADVPTPSCHVTAELISNGVGYRVETNPDPPIIAGQTSNITIVIPTVPPFLVRLVTIDVSMRTNWSSISAHNVPELSDSKSVKLNPVNHPTAHLEFDDNDNLGHPHGKIMFDIQLLDDGGINVTYTAQEIDDEVEGGTADTWKVQRDWWRSLTGLTVSNGDSIDNDATTFNFVIHNDEG